MTSYVNIQDSNKLLSYQIPYRFFGKLKTNEYPDLEINGDIQLRDLSTNVIKTINTLPANIMEKFQNMYQQLYTETESIYYDEMYDRIKEGEF